MKIKTLGLLAVAVFASPNVNAISVDLATWTDETFLNQAGQSSWNVQNAPTNDEVLQTINGQPTIFYDPSVNAQGTALSGKIRVTPGGNSDDDFIEDAGHKTPRTLKDGSAVEKTVIVRVKPRPASAPRTRQRGHLPPLKNIHEEPAWKKSQYLE